MTVGDNDVEWELEEGVPQFEDPFIQKYLNGRDALIEEEQKQRHDFNLRRSLSPVAARACEIVSRIRARELKRVWTNGLDEAAAHQADEILYPGVMFHLARDRMEETELWKIVHKMPKGSLLHAHMDAMFDVDFLIEQVITTPGMHICAPKAILSARDLEEAPIFFQYSSSPVEVSEKKPSPWTADYEASSLFHVQVAAAAFPNGGEAAFRDWLRTRLVLTADHSYHHHHGVDAIWAIFQRAFPILDTMLFYEPIFRSCLQRMLGQLASDGIRYVDFRIGFSFGFRRQGSDEPELSPIYMCQVFQDEVERFKKTEIGRNFYGARIICTVLRRFTNKQIIESMKQCIDTKKVLPDVICGFDFVGQEDQGRPLVDLVPLVFWFRKRCVEEGVHIPFFFHAGECLGDGDETDQNLFDAILLGTRRIGHGFSLYKHPLLIDLVKQKKILIECCPISNEVLRLTSSIKSHPLPALLARGVSVSLCNDDPAILGHGKNGLTHDFWQALQGLENLGLEGLAMMVENSIRWSCYEDQTNKEWLEDVQQGVLGTGLKAKRLEEWYRDFEQFCAWVVTEYVDELVDDDAIQEEE